MMSRADVERTIVEDEQLVEEIARLLEGRDAAQAPVWSSGCPGPDQARASPTVGDRSCASGAAAGRAPRARHVPRRQILAAGRVLSPRATSTRLRVVRPDDLHPRLR